ncbi:unnamed protein product [Heterobilharzia americana]|nr:unnamed protein product [Heterobilharzia americana]
MHHMNSKPYLGPEGWMASSEIGSGCYTECLASIVDQMCRKSPYSRTVQLFSLVNDSNKNKMQNFTCQLVSVLRGRIIPYSLRRLLWPLALFTVSNWARSEFENKNETIWDGPRMRQLESLARESFGTMLASGTSKLGLTTPVHSTLDGVINKAVKEITLELQTKFLNQPKQFKRFSEQSGRILNVLYSARQIYDRLYIYWLLPLHFALTKNHIYALIKHFPYMPSKEYITSNDEGVQIYSFAMCLSSFIEIVNKKYGLYDTFVKSIIEKTVEKLKHLKFFEHIKNVYTQSIFQNSTSTPNDSDSYSNFSLFVGSVRPVALLFFWDQLFLNTFESDVIIEFAQTILTLLGSDILHLNNSDDIEHLLKFGPNKLLTLDIIRTWNVIHFNKAVNDRYYGLNRLSGELISKKKPTQVQKKTEPYFYLPEFAIHEITVATVTDSKE